MSLSDKIWITRKARINTEKRLNSYNVFSNLAIIYFSAMLSAKSIWLLVHPNEDQNLFIAISSFTILLATVVISSQRFTERAINIKHCYIELEGLYLESLNAEKMEDTQGRNEIKRISTEYQKILNNVENHSPYDYLVLRFEQRNNPKSNLPKMSCFDYLELCSKKLFFILIVFLVVGFPFLLDFLFRIWLLP